MWFQVLLLITVWDQPHADNLVYYLPSRTSRTLENICCRFIRSSQKQTKEIRDAAFSRSDGTPSVDIKKQLTKYF